jgi:hypothetical protein
MNPILDTLLTDIPIGISVGTLLAKYLNKDIKKDIIKEVASGDTINAADYVAEYYPDINIVSTPEQIDSNKNLGALQKFFLKKMENNAAYIPMGESSIIATPKDVNKYILGHELGHHIDIKGKKMGPVATMLNMSGIDDFTGKTVDLERNAWEKSPIKEENNKLRDLNMTAYENAKNYARLGAIAGLGVGVARNFIGPKKILEMIRGHIR